MKETEYSLLHSESSCSQNSYIQQTTLSFAKIWQALLLIVVTILMTLSVYIGVANATRRLASLDDFSVKNVFPEFPVVTVQFSDDRTYKLLDSVGDQAWDTLMPNGHGYVRLSNARQYGMNMSSPSNYEKGAEVYAAAIVHQLHCLAALREVVKMQEGKESIMPYGSEHIAHCLDYLRQSILCAGDVGLDAAVPTVLPSGQNGYQFTGLNALHTCRAWDPLKEFLTETREEDWGGSIIFL